VFGAGVIERKERPRAEIYSGTSRTLPRIPLRDPFPDHVGIVQRLAGREDPPSRPLSDLHDTASGKTPVIQEPRRKRSV
jgi:hypothetical protein